MAQLEVQLNSKNISFKSEDNNFIMRVKKSFNLHINVNINNNK